MPDHPILHGIVKGPSPARPRIVIIGGGFSGSAFAILLMRDPTLPPCEITIVEPRSQLGAGIAYSAEDPLHRVNITAERMAALPDELEDFERWSKDAGRLDDDPDAFYPARGIFPARALFGLYVGALLRRTVDATPQIKFRHVLSRAEKAEVDHAIYRIAFASGEVIEADLLMLATGHPMPRLPWPLSELPAHRGLITNPWRSGAVSSVKPSADVLILGTGLTMGDMIASLRRQGHVALLTALSRHGLTPRPRTGPLETIADLSFTGGGQVSQILHAIRREVRQAKATGKSWSDVFDIVRQQNSEIWTSWSEPDQRRFQRHLRAYWDVHRFQAAPQIHDLVSTELATGALTVLAASMTKATIENEKISLTLRRRGQLMTHTRAFDAIINCTGATGPLIDENPVLKSLAQVGSIKPDVFGTGIDVDALSRARTRDGKPNENLFVLGPAIRGSRGEISGALEIAIQAQMVAKEIATSLNQKSLLKHR